MKHKKICIVGAGLFGCTIALVLSKAGYFVDLYEKNPDIMSETSLKNQQRFHLGYHYPRSVKLYQKLKAHLIFLPNFMEKEFLEKPKMFTNFKRKF